MSNKQPHIVRVENRAHSNLPKIGVHIASDGATVYVSRVLLSGLVASLLLRPGRVLNVVPKNTGPETFSLDAPPFRTAAYNYFGFVNETPASYAASASLHDGKVSDCDLIFQTTRSEKNATTENKHTFLVAPCASCQSGNTFQRCARKSRWGLGRYPPGGFPFVRGSQRGGGS